MSREFAGTRGRVKIKPLHVRAPRVPGVRVKREPKVAVAKPVERQGSQRVWSLLLPPRFPPDR